MSLSGTAYAQAGERIPCPGCGHTVGFAPRNTRVAVRRVRENAEAQPGTSVHLCTNRCGHPLRTCRTYYELRPIATDRAA